MSILTVSELFCVKLQVPRLVSLANFSGQNILLFAQSYTQTLDFKHLWYGKVELKKEKNIVK